MPGKALSAVDGVVDANSGEYDREQRSVLPAVAGRRSGTRFLVFVLVLTLCFVRPLVDWVRLALGTDLFSHVLLIPFVSLYFVWQKRRTLKWTIQTGSPLAVVPGVIAMGLLLVYWLHPRLSGVFTEHDYLSLTTTSYLLMLLAGFWGCYGTATIRVLAFPLGFLVFMIPWPTIMIELVEVGLQYASAEAANVLLALSGAPYLRDGLTFHLPGITLQVAQECSGVRSSYVLLITAVLGGHVLLRRRWSRWVLALAVIPLGILRNGFRILTIALLCVHVSPEMIDSPIHRRGGPLFFALSLIPFFLLLIWLRRVERDATGSVRAETGR